MDVLHPIHELCFGDFPCHFLFGCKESWIFLHSLSVRDHWVARVRTSEDDDEETQKTVLDILNFTICTGAHR